MSVNPSISVLMPVYNCGDYLHVSIPSILNQSFSDFEFLIVDDCSTDTSWKILTAYARQDSRIKIFRNHKNLRVSASLNRLIKAARGRYVARMDGDDWSYPDRLEKQFRFMESHPSVGVSGGAIEICNAELKPLNRRRYHLTNLAIRKYIFRYSPFAHPATFWRTSLLKQVGGYNENIPFSQDYELYFRVGRISQFSNLPDTLLKLRTHINSTSISRGRFQEYYALYSRLKAFLEYNYPMSFWDKTYTFLQLVSIAFIPHKLKFWTFNYFRRFL